MMNTSLNQVLGLTHALLRCLAPLDALLMPALGLYWISTWPASGGLVGAVLGVLCLWVAIKRAGHAVFRFEDYPWMTLRLAKLAITAWMVVALFKLGWVIQG